MADRFPLILNTNANQIQEIASGDTLDLTGTNIKSAGIVTASIFSGSIVAGAGVSNITAGIGTYTDLRVGGDTTFSEDFVVTGNARVTGILTVGTSSIILNESANTIKVGTALTLGHTQGLQFHTQNLHSEGFEVNQINASGIITATGVDINGDLDVDGHTNLDNVSIAGVTTFSGVIGGTFDVDGHTNLDNINITGVTTTTGVVVINAGTESTSTTTGALRVAGGVGIVKNLYVGGILDSDGPTHLDYVSISGVTTHSDTVHIIDDKVLMFGSGGDSTIEYDENGTDQLTIAGAVTRFTNTTQSTSKDTGSVILEGGLGVEKNLSVGGNVTAVDGTFSGNVSIGGTLTYEDVTNIDSVGIITARTSIKLDADGSASSNFLSIGADDDLKIFHQSNVDKIESSAAGFHIRQINNGDLHIHAGANTGSANNRLVARAGGKAELYYGGALKLSTETGGVNITGVCTATTFVGALTGTASGNATISSNADNRIITGGSGNALNGESELTYSTYLNLTRSNTDTNFTDNSAPGGVNGIFISNSQSTNGVFSAITLSANDGSGTDQSGSLISKSVSGNYTPEVHITQRTGNNTTESNIKITSARSVELNHQGTKKLHTNSNGIVVSGGAFFNATAITGTPKLYLYGYAGNDGKGVTIEGNEAGLELVSSAQGNHSSSILLRNLNDGFGFINDHDSNQLQIKHFTAVSDNFSIHGAGNGNSLLKTSATFTESSSVDLYWNNNIRIKTHEHGTVLKGGANNVHIYLQTNDGTQRGEVYANNNNQVGFLDETGNWAVNFDRGGSSYCFSNFLPGANDTYDLGATGTRWRNLYVNDLQLSNEAKKDGGGNDVDGTWGDYTIQEGESDLFLINNRSGKKYKFNLTEVS